MGGEGRLVEEDQLMQQMGGGGEGKGPFIVSYFRLAQVEKLA